MPKRPSFPRRSRELLRVAASTAVIAVLGVPRGAAADPQLTTGLTLGVAGLGERNALWTSTGFQAGVRGELLFGRDKDESFGLGPYVEALTTDGFSDAHLGAGAALLMPIHAYLPVVISAGGYAAHHGPWGWEPGLAAELFWGTHGYNYHSLYSMSAGIFAGGRYALGDSKEVILLGGARIDLELVAIPFIFLWGAIRGPDPTR